MMPRLEMRSAKCLCPMAKLQLILRLSRRVKSHVTARRRACVAARGVPVLFSCSSLRSVASVRPLLSEDGGRFAAALSGHQPGSGPKLKASKRHGGLERLATGMGIQGLEVIEAV